MIKSVFNLKTREIGILLIKSFNSGNVKSIYHLLKNDINFCKRVLMTNETINKTSESPQSLEVIESYPTQPTKQIKSKSRAREKLADILNISSRECINITCEYPKLKKMTLYEVQTILNYYLSQEINSKIILKYPWLLTMNREIIEAKISIIKQLPNNLNEIIPLISQKRNKILLNLVLALLREINSVSINRITYMAQRLQCPPDEISFAIARYHFFPLLKFKRVEQVLDILLNQGVTKENILRDFWIFKYKIETIKNRLQTAKESNVPNLKTWMVRCKTDVYNRTLIRHSANKQVLGDLSSICEYLSERLNLEPEYSKVITDKHPEIARMNITKAKEVIDYLFAENYMAEQIIRCPRILCCKLQTIQHRLTQLKSIGFKPNSLVIFCKSQNQFDKYFEIICKKLETKPLN